MGYCRPLWAITDRFGTYWAVSAIWGRWGPFWVITSRFEGQYKLFWAVLGCFISFRVVSNYFGTFRTISDQFSFGSFRIILGRFRPIWAVSGCFEPVWTILEFFKPFSDCIEAFPTFLICFRPFLTVSDCFGLLWIGLGHFGQLWIVLGHSRLVPGLSTPHELGVKMIRKFENKPKPPETTWKPPQGRKRPEMARNGQLIPVMTRTGQYAGRKQLETAGTVGNSRKEPNTTKWLQKGPKQLLTTRNNLKQPKPAYNGHLQPKLLKNGPK
jgi:hypothetical protein